MRLATAAWGAVAAAGLAIGFAACERLDRPRLSASPADPIPAPSGGPATQQPASSCKRGRWRLAGIGDLQRSLVSLSHILIRHTDSTQAVPFSVLDWRIDRPASSRTRDAAVRLAAEITRKLETSAEGFSTLARKYSEDLATQESGGVLGVFPAIELLAWPGVLDCLAGLELGRVSPPIETEYGIHLFVRTSLPPPEKFAAQRIVIGYEGADFLRYVRRTGTSVVRRTRAEALALAREVWAGATKQNFGELVTKFSEHRDAERGGDMGLWSAAEATIFPRLVRTILARPVGDLSEPTDSELGFQIFLRTEAAERPTFAVRSRSFAFDPDQTGDSSGSRSVALNLAEQALATWRSNLDADTNAESPGIGEPQFWTQGSGPHGVEEALLGVPVGQLLPRPVISDQTYVIARRVEPVPPPPVSVIDGLPSPAYPDLAHFVAASANKLQELVLAAVGEAMPPAVRDQCLRLHAAYLINLSSARYVEDRMRAWRELENGLMRLGKEASGQHRQALNAAITARVLQTQDNHGSAI